MTYIGCTFVGQVLWYRCAKLKRIIFSSLHLLTKLVIANGQTQDGRQVIPIAQLELLALKLC